jgi:hypothetical protein
MIYSAGKIENRLSYSVHSSEYLIHTYDNEGGTLAFTYADNLVLGGTGTNTILCFNRGKFVQLLFMYSADDVERFIERANFLFEKYNRQ